jgi:hypothetical protein
MAGHGRDFTAPCIALAVVNMFYYSSSIIWPTMINEFYLDDPTDWKYASVLSTVQGLTILTGVILLSIFGSITKRRNWQLTGYTLFMVVLGVSLALGTPSRKGFGVYDRLRFHLSSWIRSINLSLHCDKSDGSGAERSWTEWRHFRHFSLCGRGYSYCCLHGCSTNTVKKWTVNFVPAAAIAAGRPSLEVTSLMGVLGTSNLTVNYSPVVVSAVTHATQKAYEHGIQ